MEHSIELLQKQHDSLKRCLDREDWCTDPDSNYHKKLRQEYTDLVNDYSKALIILKHENKR